MKQLIDELKLPWRKKKNRGSLLRVMGALGDLVNEDINRVLRAFFPYLCGKGDALRRHARALGIPLFPDEENGGQRRRVSAAALWLQRRGTRGLLIETLDRMFGRRYEIFEAPVHAFRIGFSALGQELIGGGVFLVLRVRGLTVEEEERARPLLDSMLDLSVEIIILPWVSSETRGLLPGQVLLYGGGVFIQKQFADIGPVEAAVLPDEAFRLGRSPVGYSPVWGRGEEGCVLIKCLQEDAGAVAQRAAVLFDSAVNWRIDTGGSGRTGP